MKTGSSLKWIVRLAFVGLAVWFFRPAYAPPQPAQPAQRNPTDYVRWVYHSATNDQIVQSFTIYGDGRNILRLTRPMGDPDMPELIREWKLKRDKGTGLIEFTRENFVAPAMAKGFLADAVVAGAWELRDVRTADPDRLDIEAAFAARTNHASGPPDLGAAFDWNPIEWTNKQRWQKVSVLPRQAKGLRHWLEKHEIILVDDHGKEVPGR